ncbi:MAG: hypothetical protein XD43_0818 [Thermococcales archaeon 44_46]|jgi:hypothetical protein|uniref:hypothetical protein n=1 Tax=Thermococcus TaxID=2263 RepID=UPI0005B2DDC6|nr:MULTISPECIES: hypothetical protein [Thermococcus]KUJ99522.1 MAG: hypothetical protein XD43_0818 [Thermococcales archaeon 44_46]MDK2783793.1 hypothetical protein [Thermococcaceae archaeon]ALV63547.1 hypothetical protein ADU37_CDS18480 [Thermococcus sp. 2319x1]MCA6213823.1 hypothetical protein [Thermococcus bergensis]HIH73211.1 hypothetical protein [Thermococcaceae archaeon]
MSFSFIFFGFEEALRGEVPADTLTIAIKHGMKTEIGTIARKGSERVVIECKRNAHKISEEQLAKYAEYAINKGIRKIEVYYAGGIENIRGYYYYTQYLPKEIKSRFGVDVEVRYLASEFD